MNKQDRILELVDQGKRIIDKAELQGRSRTADENLEVAKLLKQVSDLRRGASIDEIGRQIGAAGSEVAADPSAAVGGGWDRLGKSINLKGGQTKAEVPLDGLMRSKAGTWPAAEDFPPVRAPAVGASYDMRYLYPNLARQALGQELSVSEFRQVGSAEVASGSVERYPTDTATKAEVDVELELVAEKVKQVAATIANVPNAILEVDVTLRAFLQQQLRVKLDQAIDAHCLAQIEAASFAGGSTGANLIEQIRNAISAMAAVGTRPTIVALSPEDAVELDLFSTGADDAYVFPLRDSGSSSPLFSLRVVEATNVVNPLLIDPVALGLLYVGQARFEVDPYSGFKENLSTVRLEGNVLYHVRNPNGAYEIGGS